VRRFLPRSLDGCYPPPLPSVSQRARARWRSAEVLPAVPAVSVVIPAWNCAPLLERALRSVAAQTVLGQVPVEVIVVDDGSTDDTAERVRALARELPLPVRYIWQENAGPAAARNRALAVATGELVAFLDADDTWRPAKLEKQLPLFDRPSVGLVHCDVAFADADGAPLDDHGRRIVLLEGDILFALFCEFFLLTSSVVMRRELVVREGGFREDLPVGEDYDFFLRVLRHCHAAVAREKLLVRTVRPDSLSRQDFVLDAVVDMATLRRFVEENPDFAAAHPRAISRRFAGYHMDFAYTLLQRGYRRRSIGQILRSLWRAPGVRAAKLLVRAMLPVRP
jgi:glycosyltransferase involved in cell wall biosynthesis